MTQPIEPTQENKANAFEASASVAHALVHALTHGQLDEKQKVIIVTELKNVSSSVTWALKVLTEGKPEPKMKLADATTNN